MDCCFCPLFSGSSGNAAYIQSGEDRLLIDCGVSGKSIQDALSSIGVETRSLKGIFLTHSHRDHLCGAGVLPRRYHLPIYASQGTWSEILRDHLIGEIASENIRRFSLRDTTISAPFDSLAIHPFPTPHSTSESVGYRISLESVGGKEKNLVVATDFGYITEEVRRNILKAEIILLESNYDMDMLLSGPYPPRLKKQIAGNYGHLCNYYAGKISVDLVKRGARQVYLGHISEVNNTPELAYSTTADWLMEKGIHPKRDVELMVANRYAPSRPTRW